MVSVSYSVRSYICADLLCTHEGTPSKGGYIFASPLPSLDPATRVPIEFTSIDTRAEWEWNTHSERCCCVRLSQCCYWSSLLSKLLQVGLVHCMNAVATALSQKRPKQDFMQHP